MRIPIIPVVAIIIASLVAQSSALFEVPAKLQNLKAVDAYAVGLDDGQPGGWERHDPSNILKHDGRYLLWMTEHAQGSGFLKSSRIVLLSSADGMHWRKEQIALEKGPPGSWDDLSVLTAYIVPHEGRYYMFYTGVDKTFEDSNISRRGMGYVVADSPYGPWKRHGGNEVVFAGELGEWDDLTADDANILRVGDKWYFYYKGRGIGVKDPASQNGLAISDNLTGPYTKYEGNPIFVHGFFI